MPSRTPPIVPYRSLNCTQFTRHFIGRCCPQRAWTRMRWTTRRRKTCCRSRHGSRRTRTFTMRGSPVGGAGGSARGSATTSRGQNAGHSRTWAMRGRGVNRQLPHLGNTGGACAQKRAALLTWFRALRDRLCRVRVVCGDWERICGDSVLFGPGTPCGVFLDPPYSQDAGVDTVYGEHHDPGVSARVRAWCAAHGDDPKLRIALCGYEGEGHDALESLGWRVEQWKAQGGYSNQSGSQNRHRERIWFSPHCRGAVQATLWGD